MRMRMQVHGAHCFCNLACSRINNSCLVVNRLQLLGWFSPSASFMMQHMVVPGPLLTERQYQAEARVWGVTSVRQRQKPEAMNNCIPTGYGHLLEEAACDAPLIHLQIC
ncbi:unnamed protein product [Polarella glacialis]|uniref:Uncharacterized protein n=1 Tax=Polarella glacialis TaxID=89957 RepID=A0A813KMY6_POLGL|nr:unnamed protein product [Polarella glacialis]